MNKINKLKQLTLILMHLTVTACSQAAFAPGGALSALERGQARCWNPSTSNRGRSTYSTPANRSRRSSTPTTSDGSSNTTPNLGQIWNQLEELNKNGFRVRTCKPTNFQGLSQTDKVKHLLEIITDLLGKIKSMDKEESAYKDLSKQYETLSTLRTVLNEQYSQAEQEIQQLKRTAWDQRCNISELQTQNRSLESVTKEYQEEQTELKRIGDVMEQEAAELKRTLATNASAIQTLENRLHKIKAEERELRALLETRNQELKQESEAKDASNAENQNLRAENDRFRTEMAQQQAEMALVKRALKVTEDRSQTCITEHTEDITLLQERVQCLMEENRAARSEVIGSELQLSLLEQSRHLSEHRTELKAAQDLDVYRTEIEAANHQLLLTKAKALSEAEEYSSERNMSEMRQRRLHNKYEQSQAELRSSETKNREEIEELKGVIQAMEGTEILKALQYNREAEAVERVRNELAEYQQLHQESQRKNTDLLGDLKILARDHQTLLSHVDGIVKEFHKAREISAEATSFTKELGSSKEAATDLIIKCFIVSFLKETVVPVFINHTRRETTEFDQWAIYIAKRILADLKSEDQRAIRQTAEEQAEAIAAKRKELLEVTEAMTELNQQNQKCFQTKSGIVVRQVQEQTQALDQQISRQRKLVEQLAEISGTKKRTRNLKKMKEDVISKISNIHSRNHLDSNSSTWLNAVYETLKSELLPYARGLKENISGGDEHFQSISWVFDNMSEESKKSLLIKEDFPVLEERFLGPIMQEIVRVKTNKLSFPRGG